MTHYTSPAKIEDAIEAIELSADHPESYIAESVMKLKVKALWTLPNHALISRAVRQGALGLAISSLQLSL